MHVFVSNELSINYNIYSKFILSIWKTSIFVTPNQHLKCDRWLKKEGKYSQILIIFPSGQGFHKVYK